MNRFTDSLIRCFIDPLLRLLRIHWFMWFLVHAVNCAWILSSHFISISTTILLIRWRTSQLQQLIASASRNVPTNHWFLTVISYFPNFRPGTWSLWYSHMGWWEWRSHGSIVSRDLVAPVAPGGIKTEEPALDHPVTQDQIRRFGGQTDPSLPWPEKLTKETGLETWTVPKKGFERTDRIF